MPPFASKAISASSAVHLAQKLCVPSTKVAGSVAAMVHAASLNHPASSYPSREVAGHSVSPVAVSASPVSVATAVPPVA